MSSLYAMQLANGDWYALEEDGRSRVPVFSSQWGGMLARVSHWRMRIFKPVALDARSLEELVPADGVTETDFWLVDDPFTSMKRGRLMDRARLATLVCEGA